MQITCYNANPCLDSKKILPNVMVCCCIFHNMILDGKDLDIQTLMIQLELENKRNVDGVLGGKKGN